MLGLKPEYFDEVESPVLKQREAGPFRIGRLLGKGVSGSAYLGTHKSNGFQVALKIVKKSRFIQNPERWKILRREIAIMKLLDHPHVLKLYDVFESSDRIFLVTELAQGGELFDYIKDGVLPPRTALKLFAQITMGLLHCHNHGIAHRDLKPENLLLDGDFHIKIADFGMAQLIKDGSFLKTSCGSPHYVSPELIDGKYEGKSSDVWSLGVILYAIVTGCLPFDHPNIPNLLRIVQKGDFEIPDEVSPDIQDLIRCMIRVDVKARIKMDDIFSHRVFQQSNYFSEKDKSYFHVETPRTTLVTHVDEGCLSDVCALLSLENRDDVQSKIMDVGENAEKSLYHLLIDRKSSRLKKLQTLSPVSKPRTLLSPSSPPLLTLGSSVSPSTSTPVVSPLRQRRLLQGDLVVEPLQIPTSSPDVPIKTTPEQLEITSKLLFEKSRPRDLEINTKSSPRSPQISDYNLPVTHQDRDSRVSSPGSSPSPTRGEFQFPTNGTTPSGSSSTAPSRRESTLTPISPHPPPPLNTNHSPPESPPNSTPNSRVQSRRGSMEDHDKLETRPTSTSSASSHKKREKLMDFLHRFSRKKRSDKSSGTGSKTTSPRSNSRPSSPTRPSSPSGSSPSRPGSPNPPRRWFASFFKRRPSMAPAYGGAIPKVDTSLPLDTSTSTSYSGRARSSSLPTTIEEETTEQSENLPPPKKPTSQSEIATAPTSSKTPTLMSLFVPPSTPSPSSSHHTSFSSSKQPPTSPSKKIFKINEEGRQSKA